MKSKKKEKEKDRAKRKLGTTGWQEEEVQKKGVQVQLESDVPGRGDVFE